jgi:hypothetical protein
MKIDRIEINGNFRKVKKVNEASCCQWNGQYRIESKIGYIGINIIFKSNKIFTGNYIGIKVVFFDDNEMPMEEIYGKAYLENDFNNDENLNFINN